MNIPFLKRHPILGIALEWSLKIIIFILLAWAIYRQVFVNKNIHVVRETILQAINTNKALLVFTLCMALVNWGLEGIKWRLLMWKVERLSIFKSYISVICGITFSMVTPNRIGDFGGRFLFLKDPLQPAAFQAVIMNSITQTIVTLLFGAFGLAMYFISGESGFKMHSAFGFVWLIVAIPVLLTLYFSGDVILDKIPFRKHWNHVVFAWTHYTDPELWGALFLAIARYAVYTLQYMLLLQVFLGHAAINLHYAAGISLVYLIQTLIPGFALFDLGIRGNAALALLSDGTDGVGIVAAAFSLWIINLVLPALIGSLIILGKRIKIV